MGTIALVMKNSSCYQIGKIALVMKWYDSFCYSFCYEIGTLAIGTIACYEMGTMALEMCTIAFVITIALVMKWVR